MILDPNKAKQLATEARTSGAPLAPPQNPNQNWEAKIRKVMVFGGIVLLIVGGIYLIKNKPKLAGGITGMLVLLFVFAYFFVGFWGPSRYQQWKNRNNVKSGPVGPKGI